MRTLLLAASLILASATTTHAQVVKYCSGSLVVNSFYSNVRSNGSTATVEYHALFRYQAADPALRTLTATLVPPTKIGTFTVLGSAIRFDISAYESKDITLFSVQNTAPSSAGAPTTAQLGPLLRPICVIK